MKTIIRLLVLAFMLLPIKTSPTQTGAYNTISGLIWCEKRIDCIHEVGHKLDDDGRWISSSQDFQDAVINIGMDFQLNLTGPKETYAEIFRLSNGKKELMPERLRPFSLCSDLIV